MSFTVDPPPIIAVKISQRPEWLRRGRIILANATDALGRAGRPALHRIADTAADVMAGIADRLVRNVIDPFGWWIESLESLIARHFAGMLALVGRQPPIEAVDDLSDRIDQQAGFLARFRTDIILKAVAGDALIARATLYGKGVWASAMNVLRGLMTAKATQERRILDEGAHSCAVCPQQAALGWSELGSLLEIGSTPCMNRCRCWFVYR